MGKLSGLRLIWCSISAHIPLPMPPREQNFAVSLGHTPLSFSQEPADTATTTATVTSQGPLVILLQRTGQTGMLLLGARRVCLGLKPRTEMELATSAPTYPPHLSLPSPSLLPHWVLLSPSLNGEGGAPRGQVGRDCCGYKFQKGHSTPRAGSLEFYSVSCCCCYRSQDPHHERPFADHLVFSALLGLR